MMVFSSVDCKNTSFCYFNFMKKIFIVIFLFFLLPLNVFAKTGISFIYINGSNINDAKIHKWYLRGIWKFHPCMKNAFEQNCFTQKCFLKNGQYFIEEMPITFFWGDKKKYCDLISPKGLVTRLACRIRLTAKVFYMI